MLNGVAIQGTGHERGMVFQQDAVFPWMTVSKNISYGPRLRGTPRARCREIEAKWIELVGLNGFEDRWPRELSGGMRKRVDIARVYANDPAVLLMDEPFGALDAQTKERMQAELQKLWILTGKTVIFVTHDLEEAIFLADRIIVLSARPGRVRHIEDISLERPRDSELQTMRQVSRSQSHRCQCVDQTVDHISRTVGFRRLSVDAPEFRHSISHSTRL